jgi:alpha-beta hydrolase superfamily lysophospholipase
MKLIKKIVLLIAIFVFASAMSAYCKTITKEIQVQTKDAKVIKSTITYVQINGLTKYPTVLLLPSLGYSSEDWGGLIADLNNVGYAVIAMDLRGHGKSIYDGQFKKKSWLYFTNKMYQKMPNDVLLMLNQVQKQVKVVDLNNMAVVGADIGANTAVLAAKDMKKKPKTMVLISPTTSFKGLYIPIVMTNLNMPILTMVSKQDKYCMQEQRNLAKFSQGGFYAKNYPQGGMGMLMIKVNPTMSQDIVKWIMRYLK